MNEESRAAFKAHLKRPDAFKAGRMLADSIARGTHHFDRDHTEELFRDCICGRTIDPDCPLHKDFK